MASIRRYNLDRTKKILEERGHEVFSYEDPSDCPLSFLTECKCNHRNFCSDVIISDVSMPFVNGLDFVESLREKGCKIRNISLISGFWTKKDISRAEKIGCTVFHKPIQPQELSVWLDNCEKNVAPQRILKDKVVFTNKIVFIEGAHTALEVLH